MFSTPRGERVSRRSLRSIQGLDRPAVAHDHDAVGDAEEFVDFRRDHRDCAARRGEIADDARDLALGADVDAARRFVEQQHARIAQEPFAQHDFLLVAAREAGDGIDVAADADVEPLDRLAARLRFARRLDDEMGAELAQARHAEIAANAVVEVEAAELSVLGDQRDSARDGLRGRGDRKRLAEQLHLAARRPSRPKRQSKISLRPEPMRP